MRQQPAEKPRHGGMARALVHSCVVTACAFLCFLLSHAALNGLLVASLGASSFIAFAFPRAESGRLRYLAGGYACGAPAGLAASALCTLCAGFGPAFPTFAICGAVAVFIATLAMILLRFQHPPAAALAVSVVIDPNPLLIAGIAMISILLICLLKYFILKFLEKHALD